MRITVNVSLKRSKSRADGKCPVYVRCTMNNQRFDLSTGISIAADSWNDEKQQVNGRTEETKILNNRLDKICMRVQDVYNLLESKGEPFSALKVKNKLLGVSDEKGVLEILDDIINGIAARIGNDYSEGTLKHYKTTRERLAKFFKTRFGRNDLSLSMVDYGFLNSFDLYLKNRAFAKAEYCPNLPQTFKEGVEHSNCHEFAFRQSLQLIQSYPQRDPSGLPDNQGTGTN